MLVVYISTEKPNSCFELKINKRRKWQTALVIFNSSPYNLGSCTWLLLLFCFCFCFVLFYLCWGEGIFINEYMKQYRHMLQCGVCSRRACNLCYAASSYIYLTHYMASTTIHGVLTEEGCVSSGCLSQMPWEAELDELHLQLM